MGKTTDIREAVEAELGNVWRYPDESYGDAEQRVRRVPLAWHVRILRQPGQCVRRRAQLGRRRQAGAVEYGGQPVVGRRRVQAGGSGQNRRRCRVEGFECGGDEAALADAGRSGDHCRPSARRIACTPGGRELTHIIRVADHRQGRHGVQDTYKCVETFDLRPCMIDQ